MTRKHEREEWDRLWSAHGRTKIQYKDWQIINHLSRFVDWTDKSILELACGRGMTSYLAKRNGARDVTLLDSSAKAIGVAQSLFAEFSNDQIRYVVSEVQEASFESKFDVVMSVNVAQYFTGPELRAFVQSHRDLSRDLVVVVSLSSPHHNDRRVSHAAVVRDYGFQKPITREEMEALFTDLGMQVVGNERFHPLYAFSLSSLLGRPRIPGLGKLDGVIRRLGVFDGLDRLLGPWRGRLGGLVVTVGRVATSTATGQSPI